MIHVKFLSFQSVSSIQACLRELIDLNDAWIWDESIMKQTPADLNTGCCQGQHGTESINSTENSASPAVTVSGQQHLACNNLSFAPPTPTPRYRSVSAPFCPSSNASLLGFPWQYLTFTQCPLALLRLSSSFSWNTIFISACLSSLTLIIGWAPAGSEVD